MCCMCVLAYGRVCLYLIVTSVPALLLLCVVCSLLLAVVSLFFHFVDFCSLVLVFVIYLLQSNFLSLHICSSTISPWHIYGRQ